MLTAAPGAKMDTKMAPKWIKNGPKMCPKSIKIEAETEPGTHSKKGYRIAAQGPPRPSKAVKIAAKLI